MKRVLVSSGMILLILVLVGTAQKRNQLQDKYGAPDVQNRYTVRPNIRMTVDFGEDGQADRIVIKPENPDEPSDRHDHGTVMPKETANEILNEVSPSATRGTRKRHAGFAAGCTSIQLEEYDHIAISTVTSCEQQGGGVYSITLTRK